MRDAHGGLGAVDVLAAGAGGAEDVDAQILGLDLDLHVVVDQRDDEDRGEGGVAAGVGVEGRDAHQAVDADFGLHLPVDVLALDFDRGALDARLFALRAGR